MPELRHDALTGRLVLLTPGRARRPHTTTPAATGPSPPCPFCPGHEAETPPETARVGPGTPDTPGWRVRVVPNLYPIVGGAASSAGATGAHEVVVLSPDHDRDLSALSDDQAIEVVTTLRDRSRVHAAAGHAYVQLLVNHGRAAGASIAHPHAQVVALDFVPPAVVSAVSRFAEAEGDPVLTDEADASHAGLGLIGGEVRAWCPAAGVAPFEVRLVATRAGARFATTDDDELAAVAVTLRDVVARIIAALGDVAYNVVVHDGPADAGARYHWWIEVTPRTAVVAGFELGTGVLVNTVDPADAAATLRAESVGEEGAR